MEQSQFEKQPHKPISNDVLPWREISKLPKEEREKLITATAQEIVNSLKEQAVEYKDVTQMYEILRGQKMIARRESPERILSSLAEHEPIHVGFPQGERYSNAVLWNPAQGPRGLDNAYLEGYAEANGIVTVIGFKESGIKDIVSLEDASQKFAGLDRAYVRSIEGDIAPSDIIFVSVRIPIFAMSEKDLTPAEQEVYEEYQEEIREGKKPTPKFVHRGFLFTQNIEKQ